MSIEHIPDSHDKSDLPQWQKDLLDARMKRIKDDPTSLHPIKQLFEELDRDDN